MDAGWMNGQAEGRSRMTNTEGSEGDKGRQIEEQGTVGRVIGMLVRMMTEV